MTVRTKQELIDRAAVLFPDQGDPLIMADELRSFIRDLVDSLAFTSQITGDMVVQLINTNLGNTDWQQPPGMTSGATLAQALAAIMIDDTPVDTHLLAIDRADPTQITISLTHTGAGDTTRYAAMSPDNMFSEAEWVAGMTSMNDMITFPATLGNHFKGFAVPASHASLVSIQQVGNPFDERASYLPAVGDADVLVDIASVAHKTYIGSYANFGSVAQDFMLR